LPAGDVIIKVAFSSLNYKDALSATGNVGVTKNYPHVPGIDASGTIFYSQSEQFKVGEPVIVTGYDLGANTDGGYSEFVRVPSSWIVPLPPQLSLKESMILGTAGFTAAISVQTLLDNGLTPEQGEVVVTGASGGVGCLAVAILAREKFSVVASTNKKEAFDFLRKLGASRIVDRSEFADQPDRPLLKAVWAGGVDTVGGTTLSTLIKSTRQHGCVATCGVVGGAKLDLTVFPFILRGVRLLGIDSAQWPKILRLNAWQKLARQWKPDHLENIAHLIRLEEVDKNIADILKGKIQGRVVIEMNE